MANSDIIYVGKSLATLLEDVPSTINYDDEGVVGATLNYTVDWVAAPALVAVLLYHPDFTFLRREDATIERMEAGWAKVSVTFKGIDPNTEDGPTYSMRGSTGSEPIETHPDFATFAGKWWDATTWNAENGAEFVKKGQPDQGKFLGFRLGEDAEGEGGAPAFNRKAGLRSYLEGGLLFRETELLAKEKAGQAQRANMALLGYIDEPPEVESFVDLEEDRTWLLITCSIEEVGDGLKVTREWRCSGRNGWDPDLYSPSDS